MIDPSKDYSREIEASMEGDEPSKSEIRQSLKLLGFTKADQQKLDRLEKDPNAYCDYIDKRMAEIKLGTKRISQ